MNHPELFLKNNIKPKSNIMKKILLAVSALFLINAMFAQEFVRTSTIPMKQHKKTFITGREDGVPQQVAPMTRAMSRNFIGTTYYDLQSNGSMAPKLYAHQDGTVSAVWTTNGSTAASRGTGYNYWDGTNWVNDFTSTDRIETSRSGWGTMTCVGDAEIVASHNGTNALIISIRPHKGTGDWTHTQLLGPELHGTNTSGQAVTSTALLWPCITSSGNTIHLIACTDSDEWFYYQGINTCLLYYRGTFNANNNTITWENPRIVGAVTSNEQKSFSGDAYAIAANGNNVAIVSAPTFSDVFLWKSTDNGANFTKTVIFQHPYPGFEESTTLVVDTPYVSDGACAVALDGNGLAHVAVGITRMLNDDLSDGSYSYFPGVCGCLYWNENMQPLLNSDANTLEPENLVDAGYQVFKRSDLNGDGGAYWSAGEVDIPGYGVGAVSIPQLVTSGNSVYCVYTALLDWPFFYYGDSDAYYWRGVFGAKSTDNGTTWGDVSWLSYNKDCYYVNNWEWAWDTGYSVSDVIPNIWVEGENMFPAVAPQIVNGKIFMTWEQDFYPGSEIKGVSGSGGASMNQNESYIYAQMMDADSIGIYNNVDEVWLGMWVDPTGISNQQLSGLKMYPNPATDIVNITFSSENAENGVISVMNLMGQTIYTQPVEIMEGYNFVTVPVNNFKSGVYLVTIRTNTGISTQKMIVR